SSLPAATIYALPHPSPLLTGPGAAAVTAVGSSEIDGWVGRPGSYLLRVRFTPYQQVAYGSICLAPAAGAMTRVDATGPGAFSIKAIETPAGALASLLDEDPSRCLDSSRAT